MVNLPGYSPDFDAGKAIWYWACEKVTANPCLGTKAAVQEKLGHFFGQLTRRTQKVRPRCRTALQVRAEELLRADQAGPYCAIYVDPTLALVRMTLVEFGDTLESKDLHLEISASSLYRSVVI